MASYSVREIGAEHISGNAATDLSAYQYRAVKVFTTGVLAADTATTSGYQYVLQNAPTSGQPCVLFGPPNVSEAKAGGAITIGQPVTANATAWFVATSDGAVLPAGHALTAAASGDVFALRLR